MKAFDEGDHLCELGTKNGEFDERLAERRALVRPFEAL